MKGASTRLVGVKKCIYRKGVGHQIGESRERGRVGIGRVGGSIEANVSDRINIKGRVAINSVIHGNRGVRQYGVTKRRNRLPSKDFSGVF